jgi:ribosomal protein S18 acetylase RimI-like enzyme
MRVRLRAVRDDEVADFVARTRDGYAEDLERSARVPREEARATAERQLAALVPDGRPAEGQHLFVVEDETRRAVGRLWFAEREQDSRPVAWIYDIAIDEHLRGRGLGRQAMLLLEEEVRKRGLPEIGLNVFGANEPARSLYRSLGYAEVSVWMSKELG